MQYLKQICAATFFLASSTLFAAPTVVKFAMEATYPPFEYVDGSGQIKGFDVDIANALCQEMKVQCQFSNQPFNSLIPSLQLGKFDALISALGITAEREKQVAFTDSYYQPSGSFVAPLAKNYKLSDVTGKTVGVQTGSTFETYLKKKYGNKVTIKTYASIQETFLDLNTGRIDIVLADTPIAQAWLKQDGNNKNYGIVEAPIIDAEYFGTGYGIAVRKDNTTLLNSLNKALAAIKANGTYAKLTKEYFGG
jgi:arginine transport system substrate-binding protein